MASTDKKNEAKASNTEKKVKPPKEKEEKKARKTHVTAIDILIIVLLLLCIVGIGFRSKIADAFIRSASDESIEISFKAEPITAVEAALLETDDILYSNGEKIGTLGIFNKDKKASFVTNQDTDGDNRFDIAEDPEKITVTGEITVSGQYIDGSFYLQGKTKLTVGKILKIYTPECSLTVLITEIPRK